MQQAVQSASLEMASHQEVSISDSHFPESSSKERMPPFVARETVDEGDGELENVRTSWAQGTRGNGGTGVHPQVTRYTSRVKLTTRPSSEVILA